VRLSIQRPTLEIDRGKRGEVTLKLVPPPASRGSHLQFDAAKSLLTLVQYDPETLALAQALGTQAELPGIAVPKLAALTAGLQRKLPLLNRAGLDARRVAPLDTRLHAQVAPLPTGLRFQLRVRPLGEGGVFCPPGQGSAELYGLLDGETVRVERDLAAEQHALDQLCSELPLLAGTGVLEPLDLTDPEQALELLEQLQRRGDDATDGLPPHWPARPVQLTPVRSAHWAPGACLADDMGLGKTVQALAVLQSRASQGPQLVIAPTSVVGNWQREAARFTPALNVRIYAEGDRAATLAALEPGSLLLLSYGLLAQDIETLKAVAFATVVYDEAQAIKNAQTLRAQAARQLQADFSIATTGTPIENHLGELCLFRIIAPGLLGSQEQFSRRFATPIASVPPPVRTPRCAR